MLRRLAAGMVLVFAVHGCAALQYSGDLDGPVLTIRNESDGLLDLAYRCAEFGPVQRLGSIAPRSTDSFTVSAQTCPTVHLVHQPHGLPRPGDARAVAVVPLFDQQAVELIFGQTGLIMRR